MTTWINANSLTITWKPACEWYDVHGDGKSFTNGKYTMQTMATRSGEFKAKFLANGGRIAGKDFDRQPSPEEMIEGIKKNLESKGN